MPAAPTSLYAGFFDEHTPVLCVAGPNMRDIVQTPRRLFALLRLSRATPPLREVVRVVSHSMGSAAIFSPRDSDASVTRFARLARAMGEDLLGEDPFQPAESWIARKPFLVFGKEDIHPVPKAYMENRFGVPPEEQRPHRLARALWAIDRRARALRILETACATSTDALDHFHLGQLHAVELGDPKTGIPHLQRACELAPNVSQPFTSLGIASMSTGDYASARDAFRSATELAPSDAGAWANLAQTCALLGDHETMRRACARAQELEPGEPITAQLAAEAKARPRPPASR
ncbi:tetratricopeptide repeat protein [Pendulispora albinea]|uniref:Tetratricopeptide repeat protein n=1 Tax=Pendulispora albinea TaxID=2741071 RepID=A0ABZ2LLH4_9BACT